MGARTPSPTYVLRNLAAFGRRELASPARDPGVLGCLVYTGSHSNSEVKQAGLSEISSIIEVEGRWRRIFENSTINLLFLNLLVLPNFYNPASYLTPLALHRAGVLVDQAADRSDDAWLGVVRLRRSLGNGPFQSPEYTGPRPITEVKQVCWLR